MHNNPYESAIESGERNEKKKRKKNIWRKHSVECSELYFFPTLNASFNQHIVDGECDRLRIQKKKNNGV